MYPDFIPNSDNLFKFLFIGGLVLIFTAIFYPMQKEQEIEIETTVYNKEVELINHEISLLKQEAKKLTVATASAKARLKELEITRRKAARSQVPQLNREIYAVKMSIIPTYDSAANKLSDLRIKNIIVKYNLQKIKLLQQYTEEYDNYKSWFLIIGTIFTIIGIAGWSYSTYQDLKRK